MTTIQNMIGLPRGFPEELLLAGDRYSVLFEETVVEGDDWLLFKKADLHRVVQEIMYRAIEVVNLTINEHRLVDGKWHEEVNYFLPYDLVRLGRMGFDEACRYTLSETRRLLDEKCPETRDDDSTRYSIALITREEWDELGNKP